MVLQRMTRVIRWMLALLVTAMLALGALWLWQSVPGDKGAVPEVVAQKSRERRTIPVEADLPWLRDVADPRPVRPSLASSAWSSRRPARGILPGYIPPAVCPWVRDITNGPQPISAPAANVPWRQP